MLVAAGLMGNAKHLTLLILRAASTLVDVVTETFLAVFG
jgi:hypothetical protein